MKTYSWLLALAFMPVFCAYSLETTTGAPPSLPLTSTNAAGFSPVSEVIRLNQSGVGDDVLIAYINNTQVPYNLSADEIVALKDAGVSSQAIASILNHDLALRNQPNRLIPEQRPYVSTPPAPALPATQNSSTVPLAPGVPNVAPMAMGANKPLATVAEPVAPARKEVEEAPPAPLIETIPFQANANYFWVPGYWTWNGSWVWVRGRWVVRPWRGAIWVSGHWVKHGKSYAWVSGRWR
jgi:hypothetical protein